MKDLDHFLSTLSIRAEDASIIPFVPNWAQSLLFAEVKEDLALGRPSRIQVAKSRQLGISTGGEALVFASAIINDNSNNFVVAHDIASAEYLFGMTKLYHETWPHAEHFKTKYSTRRQMAFEVNRSNISVMTAERTHAFRGRTVTSAHASEVAFWRNPTETMLALKQAVPNIPGTLILLESTANGLGNWWQSHWDEAEAGENEYKAMFFPWWAHPERIPCFGRGCKDGSCEVCEKASRGLRPEDDEERDLMKVMDRKVGLHWVHTGVDKAHMAWRRWAIPNLCDGNLDLFHQEHSSDPQEAFISSGIAAFNRRALQNVYDPQPYRRGRLIKGRGPGEVKFVHDPSGPLKVWLEPGNQSHGLYFIGADPTMGSEQQDFAAAHVMNRRTHEIVATWEGRINPFSFADELAKLGFWYNNAIVSVEMEGGGMGTLGRMTEIYPHIWRHRFIDRFPGEQVSKSSLGFSSTWRRKLWAIAKLAEKIETGTLTLHDHRTYEQLLSYSYYGQNRYGSDYNDDLVMALAITVVCESTEPRPEPLAVDVPSRMSDGRLIMPEREVDWEEVMNG